MLITMLQEGGTFGPKVGLLVGSDGDFLVLIDGCQNARFEVCQGLSSEVSQVRVGDTNPEDEVADCR